MMLDMSPRAAGRDPANTRLADAIACGDANPRFTTAEALPYFKHLVRVKLGSSDPLPARLNQQSSLYRMIQVLLGGSPFKIARGIVRLVAINMVNLRKAIRIGQECERYEAMDSLAGAVSISGQPYHAIALAITRRDHRSLSDELAASSSLISPRRHVISGDVTKVGYLVKVLKTGTWFPLFFHVRSICGDSGWCKR